MKQNDLSGISSENLNKTDDYYLKKDNEDKRIALERYNLLISLIIEEIVLLRKLQKKADEKESFEKNVNHAFALLEAVKEGIVKSGLSPFTDYLMTSALSYIAKYLPEASVRNIVNELDRSSQSPSNEKPSSSKTCSKHIDLSPESSSSAISQKNIDKSFNDLISRVSTTLLTPEIQRTSSKFNNNKQVVIDFAADGLPYREYGIKIAERLGANLIQVRPDHFSANNAQFSISKNTILTFIGHCRSGSDHLSDNSGKIIYAAELAEQIRSKMSQTGTPLNTEFAIDLIACQAASPDGNKPSFAKHLIKELAKRGINNASVIASPTIMLSTHDGRQANLSRKEDLKASRKMQGRKQHETSGVFSGFLSSFNSVFSNSSYEAKLNVEKVIFRANSADNVIQTKPRL